MNAPSKEVVIRRREFFQRSATALALAAVAPFGFFTRSAQAAAPAGPTRKLKKGIMWGTVGVPGSVLEKLKAIKEFVRRRRDEAVPRPGPARLLEGDNDWPAVMKALDDIGYTGWAITEQPGGDTREGLADLAQRLGRIVAS